MKFKLQTKLLITILSATVFVYVIAFGFIIYNISVTTTKNAVDHSDYLSEQSAKYFEEILNKDVEILRVVKNTFSNFNDLPEEKRIKLQNEILRNVMRETPQFAALALNWEIYALDSSYHKPYGRYRYLFHWDDGKIKEITDTMNIDGDNVTSLYKEIKGAKKSVITKIYYDSYTGILEDQILMASIAIPIINNNRYEGLIVGDITLSRFDKLISEIKPLKETKTFLLTNDGQFVAFFDDKYITKSVSSYYRSEEKEYNILENIKAGNPLSYFTTDSIGNEFYVTYRPLDIGGFKTPWSFGMAIPLNIIKKQANKLILISIIIGIIGLLFVSFVIWIIAKRITKPLSKTAQIIKKISKGSFSEDDKILILGTDEIGEIGKSLNYLIDGLISTANFAKSIGAGDLNVKFEILSKKDVLGNSLIEMRKSLKIAEIENKKRIQEEEIQSWIIKGETMFSEILREHSQDIKELSYQLISNLVRYTKATQGGLFVINDNDKNNKNIELIASYAYDRKKILSKKIKMGVGLIGRAVEESETIYMTDVPNDYVNVTSGLGERNPQSILIVPLKFNEVIYAVVELASFADFKPHMRKFIEKIGISIASTIGTVKITIRTTKLVKELTAQSQELAAQEEEMRQTMEEMQSTQEESTNKLFEMENFSNAINQVFYIAEYNIEGKLITVNDNFVNLLGKTREELLGKFQGNFSSNGDKRKQQYEIWSKVMNNETVKLNQQIKIGERIINLNEVYMPIYDELGELVKIINIANKVN